MKVVQSEEWVGGEGVGGPDKKHRAVVGNVAKAMHGASPVNSSHLASSSSDTRWRYSSRVACRRATFAGRLGRIAGGIKGEVLEQKALQLAGGLGIFTHLSLHLHL